MKINKMISELQRISEEYGDIECYISCKKQDENILQGQSYLISSPEFIVPEETEEEKYVMLKDWPY